MNEHWYGLMEFATLERNLGGPDPQLDTLVAMCDSTPVSESTWRIGCFAATYCLGSAEILWQQWGPKGIIHHPAEFEGWIRRNWQGLPLRRERRAVRTPLKLLTCLTSLAHWHDDDPWNQPWWNGTYAQAWKGTQSIWGMGRYIQLKLLEALHRAHDVPAQDCLMARGGWSPRLGLASLYPHHAEWLGGKESSATVEATEVLSGELRMVLCDLGLELNWWELQVLLCEYKQALRGKKYPGRSHDTELAYWQVTQDYWHNESNLLPARAGLFPTVCLGEDQGWMAARKPCEQVMEQHGYMWSDMLYDYPRTTDFAKPVLR